MKNLKLNTRTMINNQSFRGIRNSGILLLMLLFIFMNYSCNNNKNDSTEIVETPTQAILLNDGVKWKANAETIEGINNMILLIKNWQEDGNGGDVVLLKDDLKAEYKMIFKRCTMTGAAHDQLHNYLMPLKDYIDCLDESDSEILNTCMITLEDHLQLFFEYFE